MRQGSSRRRVAIIAHRGASAVAPESTRAAIREAIRARADMIEVDVQMTRDGRLVVFHDDRLERTTTGAGRLTAKSAATLARLDCGSWFHPRFADQRILSVAQLFRIVPPRIVLNLELKRSRNAGLLLRNIHSLIRRVGRSRSLLISSFEPRLLAGLRRTRLRRALICRRQPTRVLEQAIRLRCWAWHPRQDVVTPQHIARAHAAGLRVHVWTVDHLRLARRLIAWGVDGLFTNDPARLSHALRRP